MGLARNAGITFVVTALLIGSLIFLFPGASAAPAAADIAPTGISSVKCGSSTQATSTVSATCTTQSATVTVNFQMPADTPGIAGTGTLASRANTFAQAVTMAVSGTQGTCSSPKAVDNPDVAGTALDLTAVSSRTITPASTGPYGSTPAFVGVTATYKVNGCTFFTDATDNTRSISFTAAHATSSLADTEVKAMKNPFKSLSYIGAAEPVEPASKTATGTTSATKTYTVKAATADAPVTGGVKLDSTKTSDAGSKTSATVTPTLKTGAEIRGDTEIIIEQSPEASKSAPSFGISATELDGVAGEPMGFLHVKVNDPVDGGIDPKNVMDSLEATVCSTAKDLRDAGMTSTSTLTLKAFYSIDTAPTSDLVGKLKPAGSQPTRATDTVTATAGSTTIYGPGKDVDISSYADTIEVCATFVISDFSSFAVMAAAAPPVSTGGGGGTRTVEVCPETDADCDGLADAWEEKYFGNLDRTAAEDSDSDGLTNAAELLAGTNPNNADTDGDGVNDGDEVDAGTSPTQAAGTPGTNTTTTVTTTETKDGPLGGAEDPTSPFWKGFAIFLMVAIVGGGIAAFVWYRRQE